MGAFFLFEKYGLLFLDCQLNGDDARKFGTTVILGAWGGASFVNR